ncbi:LuxR family transcriptional regulator [Acrocarpospora pleiomorpha]|uniref:LuxR family transcriptional regulator n=1 Tax=Acrocarpospora pleiomorpha TaxID=90975 RepID=A0A5M3XAR9_9ACTN|nr:AAA family ATPase [Acrocarpospora pleiomorpha]GES18230.1 LuxR family transcriptional regulator [Acrocarpospora pleiomorpha]
MDGLFERGRELDELDAHFARAAAGAGRLVVVEGPAGIGKSRLLAEIRRRAEGSMRVLWARGSGLEGEFAFGVVRQLFEAELAGPERREALLAGAAVSAAAVFGEPDSGADGGGATFASLHGLYWLVLNLAEDAPLLLAVDDLHWCDRPSLLFLAYLARRLESQPILLLMGLRDAEPGTDPALLGEITHDPAAISVRPRPLSGAGVAEFIKERLGMAPDGGFLAACHESTGGNPLLLSQLVTALRSEGVRPDAGHVGRVKAIGPQAVSRTVLLRLARLPAEARAVAQAVAVLGDGAGIPTVAKLADVAEGRLAAATRGLAHADILRPELPLSFVHPLVRDAIYHELSPGERELQHARAAALLRDRGAPAEQVAAQLLHTSPRGERWAAELLREAGRDAMHAGAVDSAVAYLRRALDDTPADTDRGRLLLELGAAEVFTSGQAAAKHLALAYEELAEPASRAAAAGLLGRALLFLGSAEEAASIARRAATELPDELDDLRMGLEAFEFMTIIFRAGDPRHLSRLREYRRLPGGGPGSRMLAAMAAWEAVCTDGNAAECAALALAALAGDHLRAADPALIVFAAIVTLVVTDRPEVVEVWQPVIADTHRRGSLLSAASIHIWHGFSNLRRGDLAAAEESLRTAESEFALWGHADSSVSICRTFLAETLHERGRSDVSGLLVRLGTIDPGENTTGWWLGTRVVLLTAAGRAVEAVATADELAAHCAAIPDPARLWWRSLKAEALDRLDRRAEAIELTRQELEVTREFGAPWSLGRTLRVLGVLERDEDRLREAVSVLEGSTARLEHAKALAALGFALRRDRKPTEAREPLRRALEVASACGAERLAEQVRSELHASGARPRRDALSGVQSLTPGERRVVDLAAAGRTNRDIAQELYVTPGTVEVHLSNAYRKLGIRSRSELERVLAAIT